MKALKWLLILVIVVPLLVFAALAAFLSFADLSQYKDSIEKQAEAATGRKLSINGDIDVSLFPWVKLETGAIELANAEGFGDQPMISLSSASAGVKLLPLFSGNIELDVVSVQGLQADLQVNAAGVSNLDDLSGGENEANTEDAQTSGDSSLPALTLGGLALNNASLRYRDASSGMDAQISDINLNIGVLDGTSDTPVEGSLNVLLQPDNLSAKLTLDTKIRANLQDMRFHALGLDLKAALAGDAIPNGAIDLGVGGDLEADLVAQTLDIPKLKFQLGDTNFDGEAKLTGLDQAMPSVSFNLAGDSLNVDKLLGTSAQDTANTESTTTAESNAPANDAIELPTDLMRSLDINGQMTLENMIVSNVEMSAITLQLKAKDGLLSIPKLAASLYEGSIDSNASLDVRNKTPLYSADAQVSGVQAHPLLAAAADFEQLLGKGNIQININTAGNSVSKLTEALDGSFNFSFADGAIDGVNLAAEGRKVMRMLGKDVGEDPADGSARQTDFSALSASAKISQGVVESTDLSLLSPLLRVGGEGTVALPAEMVDYTVKLLLTKTLEGQGGVSFDEAKGIRLPLHIKGTFTELSEDFVGTVRRSMQDGIKADLKAQADAKLAEEKAKLKAKLDAEKAEAKAKLDAERAAKEAELKEKAEKEKARLKEKADKEKERLKEKASEALKKLF
ncbi:MAG: AsmA family protein [Granulosicoccaceae bacterium]